MAVATEIYGGWILTPGIAVSAPAPLAAAIAILAKAVAHRGVSTVLDGWRVVAPVIAISAPTPLAAASSIGTKTVADTAASAGPGDGCTVVTPSITVSAPAPNTATTTILTNSVVDYSIVAKSIIAKRGAYHHQKGGSNERHDIGREQHDRFFFFDRICYMEGN